MNSSCGVFRRGALLFYATLKLYNKLKKIIFIAFKWKTIKDAKLSQAIVVDGLFMNV